MRLWGAARRTLTAFALVGCLASCNGGHEIESLGSSGQEVTVPDSPDFWQEFVLVMDYHIADEKNGMRPSGGSATWPEFWANRIRALRESQENDQKYVNYIVQARRRAGLPELSVETIGSRNE